MAIPKKRISKRKTRLHKKRWKRKANRNILNAMNWASLILTRNRKLSE